MNQSRQLEPALLYNTQGTWLAWNVYGQKVLEGTGTYDLVVALLRNRGYHQVPPNSKQAEAIREMLYKRLKNEDPDEQL